MVGKEPSSKSSSRNLRNCKLVPYGTLKGTMLHGKKTRTSNYACCNYINYCGNMKACQWFLLCCLAPLSLRRDGQPLLLHAHVHIYISHPTTLKVQKLGTQTIVTILHHPSPANS